MAVQWEFCNGVQPTGDGVSLVPQQWQPVTNFEMLIALGGRDGAFWYQGQTWEAVCTDAQDMRLYQSYTNRANTLLFRPIRHRFIIVEVYASIIPNTTWVRLLGSEHASPGHKHACMYIYIKVYICMCTYVQLDIVYMVHSVCLYTVFPMIIQLLVLEFIYI